MRHRALGNNGKNLLGARLPVAAVNEQQRRRLFGGLQKIDPVALARAVAELDMTGVALAHFERTLLPAGHRLHAALDRHAVVEAEVALLLAHRAPIQRREQCRHSKSPIQPQPGRVSNLPENVLQHHDQETQRTGETRWLIRGWCERRRVPLSAS